MNHKRVHRIYRAAGLALRRKRRKHCVRVGRPLVQRTAANQDWALDFVHDAVACGRTIRVLSVVDAYTRECLALEVDTSFASRRVARVLEAIIARRGAPQVIRCDNGPELTSRHFLAWAIERGIELVHIQPGKPVQNGRLESFNGKLREECLNVSWFQNLFDARRKIAAWQTEYNQERPHSSLGYRTPSAFARQQKGKSKRSETSMWRWRGKRTQTPSPCPTPPSPLKARMELTSTLVFRTVRNEGEGQRRSLIFSGSTPIRPTMRSSGTSHDSRPLRTVAGCRVPDTGPATARLFLPSPAILWACALYCVLRSPHETGRIQDCAGKHRRS